MTIKAQLHLHSNLSPWTDWALSPKNIAHILHEEGVRLAALTDLNTARNAPAFAKACEEEGVAAFFGMEAQTAEEVRVLVLFRDLDIAVDFCDSWYEHLPHIKHSIENYREQYYVDEWGNMLGRLEYYLASSAKISLYELEARAHEKGALVIPSHADSVNFSLVNRLGTIPDLPFDALEFNARNSANHLLQKSYPVIPSQEVNFCDEIEKSSFLLDIGNYPLFSHDGKVNLEAVFEGLAKWKVRP